MTEDITNPVPPTTADEGATAGDTGRVSSPASTGGAGTFFEQHVDAYWLAQLLVRSIPPILHDCAVVEVHLQTEHLGWRTDDFLVVGQTGAGSYRKLVGQVKNKITVSASDDEFKKAVLDFWQDFKNPQLFASETDRIALVTLRGTNVLLENFAGLLDVARTARDGGEFERLLATPGFLNSKAKDYCNEVQSIVGETKDGGVSVAEVWPLLRVLHVLSLDLNTSTRQTEAAIKTLLAYTASDPNPLGVAEATWNTLLREVGEGMPSARSFRRADLPETLRQRHSSVGGPEHLALQALSDHSALIQSGIRSTIGPGLHLSRRGLVQEAVMKLESAQVVVVQGVAGSGKSGIAKDLIGLLSADHFTFSFRAEEFASPHLDEMLQRNRIPCSARMLGAVMAGQERKVLLVESVERLLEASTRDAFTDLLTLVTRDPSWRLILTCRDYSADLVRSAFVLASGVSHAVVCVPFLSDEELQEVAAAYPKLAYPLGYATLNRLLRTPYVLDKALQIDWSGQRPLPLNEREFRGRFWQDIVRAEHHAAHGMPRRRAEAFVNIALRRAQALTLYAPSGDLDAEVVDALRRDSLIVCPRDSDSLVAPAHDVLEDWALLQWIEEQYLTHDGSVVALSSKIGAYPALRRAYRKWVSELVERDSTAADRMFHAVINEKGLSAQFRDDTLVSLLRSTASVSLLERNMAALFANEKELLRRVIHLLRVACVTIPTWLEGAVTRPSLFSIPDGDAWACVLQLVQGHLESFTSGEQALLLGLVDDWARSVSWHSPYPAGAGAVAAIAHWLLPFYDNYQSNDQRKRNLRVIAKIPKADPQRFAALLIGPPDGKRDRAADDLRAIILEGIEGMPAARDLPETVVEAAKKYLLCTEADLQTRWGYDYEIGLESLFGIRPARNHGFFPESAYRGPYLPLMRHHPTLGLDFVIAVVNHSTDWYAHPRKDKGRIEPPYELTIEFPDGKSRKQWGNSRLWNLYRGTSVGPHVLQSLLMALESWLLEVGEARSRDLDGILVHILQHSDSAALTAVVASVATAFPHASGEALLVLLSSRQCLLLDRNRLLNESGAPSKLPLPRLNDKNQIYEYERAKSDSLSHRRHHLETAITNLQLGPLAERVQQFLDRHRASMKPLEHQDEGDRIWRLALHRMDLRQYRIENPASGPAEGQTPLSNDQTRVLLSPKPLERDLKEMVDQASEKIQTVNSGTDLLMWGLNVFERKDAVTYDPAKWRERLHQAESIDDANLREDQIGSGVRGAAFVAAVCVRDHWEELSAVEQEWCLGVIGSEVERDADNWNEHARVQRGGMFGDRPSAMVLPSLLGKQVHESLGARVRRWLVLALTHAVNEVRWYAAWGVGRYLWRNDRELALRCANALAAEAKLVQQIIDSEQNRPYEERRQISEIEAEAASVTRELFGKPDGIAADAHTDFDLTRWHGADTNTRILAIFSQAPTESLAVSAFQRLSTTLTLWWDEDDERRQKTDQERHDRNPETETALLELLEEFLLRTTVDDAKTIVAPIVAAIDRHPDKVYWVLLGLLTVEDRQPNPPKFWALWDLFALKVRTAQWLRWIDEEYSYGDQMIQIIFLVTRWKENVRHWRSLEGYQERIHALFEDLPLCSKVVDAYVYFLYYIGEQSLPEAFVRVAKRLRQGNPGQMMKTENTVFLLEALLERYVYGKPRELKSRGDLREAVLFLLDLLVEQGSSAAFRMRDDFVTPVSGT